MVIPDKSGWLINKIEAQQMLEMLEIIIADESFVLWANLLGKLA